MPAVRRTKLWVLLFCLSLSPSLMAIGTYEIEPTDLLEKIRSGNAGLVIDLRDTDQYQLSHIPTAKHVDYRHVYEALNKLQPEKQLLVTLYCGDGTRSAIAMTTLRKHNYTNIINVHGNMNGWIRQKLPVASHQN